MNARTGRPLVLVACYGTIGCATVATLTFTSRIEEETYNEHTEARESCARLLSDSAAPLATQASCRKILAGPASVPPPCSEQEGCGDAPFDPFDAP